MLACVLTEQEFADELDEIEVRDRRDVGGTLIIAGESARFGAVVLMQTFEGFMLTTGGRLGEKTTRMTLPCSL